LIVSAEKYLGGFYTIQMYVGWYKQAKPGVGIYITSKRLIGVLQSRPSFDKQVDLMPQNLTQEQNDRILSELETRKSFDAANDRISRIELKIPPGLFRTGHLKISLTTGEIIEITVGRTSPGEHLRDLFQTFFPQALALV
jgi:hypothetical protein